MLWISKTSTFVSSEKDLKPKKNMEALYQRAVSVVISEGNELTKSGRWGWSHLTLNSQALDFSV